MQQVPFAFGLFAMALFFASLFVYAMRTGHHVGRYGLIDRYTTPRAFWIGQTILAVMAVLGAVSGVLTLP